MAPITPPKLELRTYRTNRHPRVKFDADCADDAFSCSLDQAGQSFEPETIEKMKRKRYEPVGESNAYGRDRHS